MASVRDVAGCGAFLSLFMGMCNTNRTTGRYRASNRKPLSPYPHFLRLFSGSLSDPRFLAGVGLLTHCAPLQSQGVPILSGDPEATLPAPRTLMDDTDFDFGIVYIIQNAQQFWSGECPLFRFFLSH